MARRPPLRRRFTTSSKDAPELADAVASARRSSAQCARGGQALGLAPGEAVAWTARRRPAGWRRSPPSHDAGDAGQKEFLIKERQQVPVASHEMFVGRRRELQKALRALRDGEHAGVLLHGMGRLGKSSLAARIANRRRDLRLAVVFGHYGALDVLAALSEALRDSPKAREAVKKATDEVRQDLGPSGSGADRSSLRSLRTKGGERIAGSAGDRRSGADP